MLTAGSIVYMQSNTPCVYTVIKRGVPWKHKLSFALLLDPFMRHIKEFDYYT
jgi:hypothetical protein